MVVSVLFEIPVLYIFDFKDFQKNISRVFGFGLVCLFIGLPTFLLIWAPISVFITFSEFKSYLKYRKYINSTEYKEE